MYQETLDYLNNITFYNNIFADYLYSFFIFLGSLLVLYVFERIILKRAKVLAGKTEIDLDDLVVAAIGSLNRYFYFTVSLYISSRFLELSEFIDTFIFIVFIAVSSFYGVRIIQSFVDYGGSKIIQRRQEEDFDPSPIKVLTRILKGVLWVIAIILILENIGYNVSTLIAGIGIGGVAIAFALQNVLEDFFSYFSIYFDKPFKKDDLIAMGDDMGTVKKVGIKTTRLETLRGEELVISNQELTSSKIHNYKKMKKRRISFDVGILYETPLEQVKKIPDYIEEIIKSEEYAEFDRTHFKSFGDSSLDFEIVYYMLTDDYNKYMDTQQSINLKLFEKFENEGIGFAYPTRTVYVQK